MARRGYDGVVVGVPLSIPHQRFSIQDAHWWIGRALREVLRGAGIDECDLDGLTEHFGRICIAQRENALSNPQALMKYPLSMAQYLAARMIADPIALFDCVMPCAGAEPSS